MVGLIYIALIYTMYKRGRSLQDNYAASLIHHVSLEPPNGLNTLPHAVTSSKKVDKRGRVMNSYNK